MRITVPFMNARLGATVTRRTMTGYFERRSVIGIPDVSRPIIVSCFTWSSPNVVDLTTSAARLGQRL
jgi:hypothetical protein